MRTLWFTFVYIKTRHPTDRPLLCPLGEARMPNLTSILRDEISRLARKELRKETTLLKKQVAQHRHDIAELKRNVEDLARRLTYFEKVEKRRIESERTGELPGGTRFSAKGLRSHRARLGFSAEDYGRLIGASALSVYNWEQGKTRPSDENLAAIVAIRGMGKREAVKRLRLLEEEEGA